MKEYFSKKRIVILSLIILLFALIITIFILPKKVRAFPWGGQFKTVIPCFNGVTWALTGPPRGGAFIWVPAVTRTYQKGPPTHAGQYGIGLAGPPYFCIVSPYPVIVFPGIIMTMLGTS